MVVVILGPELRSWPLRLQVMVMGMSPFETTQVNCANSPESTTSLPKEKGTMLGGSKRKYVLSINKHRTFPVTSCLTNY